VNNVSAVIGALFLGGGGFEHAREFISRLGIPVPAWLLQTGFDGAEGVSLVDYAPLHNQAAQLFSSEREVAFLDRVVEQVEQSLGYSFKVKALALQAVMHPSVFYEDSRLSFERLETLGDAVLKVVVIDHILKQLRTSPGVEMLRVCPAEVNNLLAWGGTNEAFAYFAVQLKLHRCLIYRNPILHTEMLWYVAIVGMNVQLLQEILQADEAMSVIQAAERPANDV
jgi:hypothetical protein